MRLVVHCPLLQELVLLMVEAMSKPKLAKTIKYKLRTRLVEILCLACKLGEQLQEMEISHLS